MESNCFISVLVQQWVIIYDAVEIRGVVIAFKPYTEEY